MKRSDKVDAYKSVQKLEYPYLEQGVKVLKQYERMRELAVAHDADGIMEVVEKLAKGLDFKKEPGFSWKLYRLYQLIHQCVEEKNFREACRIADQLHKIWKHALLAEANNVSVSPKSIGL